MGQLLERGHRVRGTVRSEEKGEYLRKLFSRHSDKFTYVIADDLESPGAFDEAAKGVDGVLHTASPFHLNAEGKALTALVNPAVNGTKNVLSSIHKAGGVKRVVITSSFASISKCGERLFNGHAILTEPVEKNQKLPYTFTEKDWNESDPVESEKEGNKQVPIGAYRASKTLAERAAWEFVESNSPSFDLATINPPLVLGPIIHQCKGPESLNTSAQATWNLIHGGVPGAGSAVDVRDAAQAHVEALVRPDAGGQRFAPTIGHYNWKQCADIIHSSKNPAVTEEWKKGTKTDIEQALPEANLDGSKTARELGVKYHSLQQM